MVSKLLLHNLHSLGDAQGIRTSLVESFIELPRKVLKLKSVSVHLLNIAKVVDSLEVVGDSSRNPESFKRFP